jgi:hypothetical protein
MAALHPIRATSAALIWWPPLSEGSCPGDVGEAAALVLAIQKFVANGVGDRQRGAARRFVAGADR